MFESAALSAMPNVKSSPGGLFPGVTWPYIEGLAINEAWNDLAFISVGQYNATLSPQSGAPVRLTVGGLGGSIDSGWISWVRSERFNMALATDHSTWPGLCGCV